MREFGRIDLLPEDERALPSRRSHALSEGRQAVTSMTSLSSPSRKQTHQKSSPEGGGGATASEVAAGSVVPVGDSASGAAVASGLR
jgi:hypothetical protein